MFDDDFKGIGYNYFKSDAIVETNTGTYAEKDADMVLHTRFHGIMDYPKFSQV